MIYKVKYSFDYGGKYYAPGDELSEEMYNIACAKHADRVYVEGVIPSSLKSLEELEKEAAELELEIQKRKQKATSKAAEEAVDSNDNNQTESKETKETANSDKKPNPKK